MPASETAYLDVFAARKGKPLVDCDVRTGRLVATRVSKAALNVRGGLPATRVIQLA